MWAWLRRLLFAEPDAQPDSSAPPEEGRLIQRVARLENRVQFIEERIGLIREAEQ